MASVQTMPAPGHVATVESVAERRQREEWSLLEQLVALNPTRLSEPRWNDSSFAVTLRQTPASSPETQAPVTQHRVRLVYPRFFPAVPLELYLAEPMLHPNIHPLTGFVCLWDQHRVSNTVEHALHKTVAMLGWRLLNTEPRHVMQPAALSHDRHLLAQRLASRPLLGIAHQAEVFSTQERPKRRRLS